MPLTENPLCGPFLNLIPCCFRSPQANFCFTVTHISTPLLEKGESTRRSRPTAIPNAAEMEVELWPAPKASYSLSDRLVNPVTDMQKQVTKHQVYSNPLSRETQGGTSAGQGNQHMETQTSSLHTSPPPPKKKPGSALPKPLYLPSQHYIAHTFYFALNTCLPSQPTNIHTPSMTQVIEGQSLVSHILQPALRKHRHAYQTSHLVVVWCAFYPSAQSKFCDHMLGGPHPKQACPPGSRRHNV
jgi:hypothetical protein